MKDYSPHWSTTILAAIVLHFAAALGFSFVAPTPEVVPTIEAAQSFEWIDVDLSDEVIADAQESSPQSTPSPRESSSPFNAQDLFVPELPTPQLPTVEQIQPPEVTHVKPIERPQLQPPDDKPKVERPAEAQPKVEQPPKVDAQPKIDAPAEVQRLEQPPVALKEVYPEAGSGLGYKGFVSIAATVGTDGKVHETEILQSSGRYFVDEIALKAAVQWTFKPARDTNGRPMQSIKIITFDFRKFS